MTYDGSMKFTILNDDKEVVEVSFEEWQKWVQRGFDATKRVAQTDIDRVCISTVFLGVSHRGMFFETMTFNASGREIDCVRYKTWAQAEAGHALLVERYRAMQLDAMRELGRL